MLIREMFARRIDRDVKGVVKIGHGEYGNVKQELEEYVVTRELQKHFAEFFSAYKKSINGETDRMGVWISGFFGSGKSHFLKILSYILENREVEGKKAIDYFIDGDKISDRMVLADMRLAAETPADVILFNIDSKGESDSKQDKDAIVSAFLKVFNEMQGFYGANPHIADLERKLSYDGLYDDFKSRFEDLAGTPWTEARNDFDYSQDEVVDVLVDMGVMSEIAARNWCEKAFTPYSISIERFADLVKKYIDRKGRNHHVVFMVDEMGQYIGEDSRLMLNLQTVTEDLGVACKGKAWVMVTSQQDIDSVINVKGNDFSKIMGRFDTRLALSSANVDEVIRERILKKTDVARQTLQLLYDEKATVIKNTINFNDGIEKRLYRNRDDFAAVYPMVPYQFNLLGSALTSIRVFGAAGKHLAEGERSMLALSQESTIRIMDRGVGALIPFYMFYDALQEFVEPSYSSVISRAWENEFINPDREDDCFNVNVLKALFLVKYVKEIKRNVNNIASLMVTNIDEDRLALVKRVEDALKVLVKQTLVQKQGDEYVFLTHEEQDIERWIQQQSIDSSELTSKVSEMIFDGVFTDKKYKYPAFNNRYAFQFNQVVDDRPYKGSSGSNLTLHVLTPNNPDRLEDETLRSMSLQNNCVLVVLPDDRTFLDELLASAKIEKFLRFDATNTVAKYEEIKTSKRSEMREHSKNANTFLNESLRAAEIYVSGDKLQSSSKDIASRINEALGKLVGKIYHKLSYIDAPMGETDIRMLIKGSDQISIGLSGQLQNELALNDMRDYIAQNTSKHMKTSMRTLMNRFMAAPYGFVEDDVKWLVAKLYKNGDIALFVNSEPITSFSKSEEDVVRYLTKKEFIDKLMTEEKQRPPQVKIDAVRRVMKEVFNVTSSADNEDSLMSSFLGYARNLKQELEKLEIYYQNQPRYPGKQTVSNGKKLLLSVLGIKYAVEFCNCVYEDQDDWLEFAKEYEPIKSFFDGEQKKIFDDSLHLIGIYEQSKTYIVSKEVETIVRELRDILKMQAPYGNIHKLPELNKKYTVAYNEILDKKLIPVVNAIEDAKARVMQALDGKTFAERFRDRYTNRFKEIREKAESNNNVASLEGIKVEADALKLRLLGEIADEEQRERQYTQGEDGNGGKTIVVVRQKSHRPVSIKDLSSSTTWQIETSEDVEKYLSALRKSLLANLDEDTILDVEL